MELNLRFLPPIPDGMWILEPEIEVAGVNHHIDAAVAFANRQNQRIELERDLQNPHDPNAIKVIGVSHADMSAGCPHCAASLSIPNNLAGQTIRCGACQGMMTAPPAASFSERHFVGYLPRATAMQIVQAGLWETVKPRLRNIWVGGYQKTVVYIRLDVLGPKPVSDGTEKKKKPSRRKRKPKLPVERPPALDPLYLPSIGEGPPARIFCEKCKHAHLDVDCPTCGNDHRGACLGSCFYCNTEFGGSRKNCPICTVEKTFEKAQAAFDDGDVVKAVSLWRNAYDDVCANRYMLDYGEVVTYAEFLAAATFTEDAMKLLKEVRARFGKVLAASSRTAFDFSDYFFKLTKIHEAMASILASDPKPTTPTRPAGILFHGLLQHLYRMCGTHYSANGSSNPTDLPSDSYYTNRMKAILRQAKLNKLCRPEQLQEIFTRHWQTVPQINTEAVRDDIVKLTALWVSNPKQ